MRRGRPKKYVESEPFPHMLPMYGGQWMADGDGWAVYGATQREALENYWKAEQRHQEILAMPSMHRLVEPGK